MTPSNTLPLLRKVHPLELDCKFLERVMMGSLTKAFTAALLLTGSEEAAEAATCLGFQWWSVQEQSPDSLLRAAAGAAIVGAAPEHRTETPGRAQVALPPELWRLMCLPASIRQPFVLRVLMGWPREVCGDVPRRTSRQIDEDAYAAARALAGMVREWAA